MTVKARKVTIKGPRGEISKDFSHKSIDIRVMKMATAKMKGLYVRIQMWNGGYKQACAVTTFKSLISNCITGVTEVSRRQINSLRTTLCFKKLLVCLANFKVFFYYLIINYKKSKKLNLCFD